MLRALTSDSVVQMWSSGHSVSFATVKQEDQKEKFVFPIQLFRIRETFFCASWQPQKPPSGLDEFQTDKWLDCTLKLDFGLIFKLFFDSLTVHNGPRVKDQQSV